MNKTEKWGLAFMALLMLLFLFFALVWVGLESKKTDTPPTAPRPARHRLAHASKGQGYLSATELLKFQGCDCLYVYRRGAPSLLDDEGEVWSGKTHDVGIFPQLGITETGYVKTVMRAEGKYRIIYFRRDQLTWNYRATEWYAAYGDYSDVVPEVPQLCPRPGLGLIARLSVQ